MKVTGFTFIRNAIKYDYPVVEAIRSVLPVCDEFIVAVGNSEDETHQLIKDIDPDKIRIIETTWDDTLRENGSVLALETDKAFNAISSDTDWCFYIQGDEVVHEKYLDAIHKGMEKWKDHKEVDGLLFKYLHFYGSYDYFGSSPAWYGHEIRIIRNNKSIHSYRDAQGFRKGNNQKLNVKPLDAYIYHYGWVKDPHAMQHKVEDFHKLWHDDEWVKQHLPDTSEFDFLKNIDSLQLFKGTHPKVMEQRIKQKNWAFNYDISFNKLSLKKRLKLFAERKLNINMSYKNYKLI